MWNLARVSCVPDSVEVHGYVLVNEEEGRYAYGFLGRERLANQIINALCRADSVTAESVEEGTEPHYLVNVSADTSIECQEQIIRGEMSVLECNSIPVAYIVTSDNITTKLLTVLNEMRIDV